MRTCQAKHSSLGRALEHTHTGPAKAHQGGRTRQQQAQAASHQLGRPAGAGSLAQPASVGPHQQAGRVPQLGHVRQAWQALEQGLQQLAAGGGSRPLHSPADGSGAEGVGLWGVEGGGDRHCTPGLEDWDAMPGRARGVCLQVAGSYWRDACTKPAVPMLLAWVGRLQLEDLAEQASSSQPVSIRIDHSKPMQQLHCHESLCNSPREPQALRASGGSCPGDRCAPKSLASMQGALDNVQQWCQPGPALQVPAQPVEPVTTRCASQEYSAGPCGTPYAEESSLSRPPVRLAVCARLGQRLHEHLQRRLAPQHSCRDTCSAWCLAEVAAL